MLVDACLHPSGLTDQDLETLRFFGVEAVVVPCDGSAVPATVKSVRAHFDDIVEVQLPRLKRAGLRGYAAFGVHPAALPRRGLPELLHALPEYLSLPQAVAVGAIGLSSGDDAEQEAFSEQLKVARRLKRPAVVTLGHSRKDALLKRALKLVKASGLSPNSVLIQSASLPATRLIAGLGHWAALTLHPDALSVEAAVRLIRAVGPQQLMLQTAAGEGASDLLALCRAESLLRRAGLTAAVVDRVTGLNALKLFGRLGPAKR